MTRYPVVVALTGASGAPYGVRLLDVLARSQVPVWLIASSHGGPQDEARGVVPANSGNRYDNLQDMLR